MRFSLFYSAAIATLVNSTAIDITKRDSPLRVELTSISNSKVKATVTNTGAQGFNLLYKGSFLDEAPVDKLIVSSSAAKAAFKGVLMRMKTSDLSEASFMAIEAGQTIEKEIDVAEIYDVEASDTYAVQALGTLAFAEIGATELAGAVDFSSNTLSMDIDGAQAKEVAYAIDSLEKRTRLSTSSCTSSTLSVIRTALANCATLASAAATQAASGSATKFQEYFMTTSSTTRSTVAARLRAVASECSSTTSGGTTTYCNDPYGYCTSGVLAYTIPSLNVIAYCNLFYTAIPAISRSCHAQDQATTVLHESTHAPAVYSPGTQDNAYGYTALRRLSTSQAVLNADTYAMYANAIYAGC